jgi:hypothetical protein
MLTEDFYLAQRMMETKVAEQVREAETRRLIHQMGGGQSAWLTRMACWLLCHVGRALVSLGQWLQRSAAPRSRTLELAAPMGHE